METRQLQLLKIIKHNGDVTALAKQGLEFVQITSLIKEEISKGNAEFVNGKLLLSESGHKRLAELNKAHNYYNSQEWILPEYHSKIEQIDINEIYVPRKLDLWFLKEKL